jgi:hypothetical protein
MTDLLKLHILEKQHCDICGLRATRWFGMTSATACNSEGCYAEHQSQWDELFEKLSIG